MNPKALSTVLATVSIAVLAGPFAGVANAQGLSERIQAVGEQRREAARNDVTKAKLLGALLYTDVTVAFDKTTAKTAFEYVAQQMGVPLVVRYAGEGGSDGIDPELEVSLSLEGAPAITAIERLLEICGTEEPCTWQIREGFVEAGTKERLAAPAARELRMYPIRDLLFQPPTFDNAPDFNLSSALSAAASGVVAAASAAVAVAAGSVVAAAAPVEAAAASSAIPARTPSARARRSSPINSWRSSRISANPRAGSTRAATGPR
jgi:hypothetical protein